MDPQTQTLLQEVLRRESRSLLQYLAESYPWTTEDKHAVVDRLQHLCAEERDAAGRIARYLTRHHVPLPYLGSYPMDFTTINFIGVDYALSRLLKATHLEIAMLEMELNQVSDSEARELLEDLLAMKQNHLEELQKLGTSLPSTTLR
jgi:hypothetical protein